ncbi:somatomedin-B and thrombospondin type-1 domain-containing protein [Stigmatopora argus]
METLRLLLLLGTVAERHLVWAGCLGKCCEARDLSCTSADWRMDRVHGTCYCDRGCAATRDCCFDYFSHCPARACSVNAWSFWSGCAESCRPSWRARVRRVSERPANGGDPCPPLEERAGCMDYRDRRGSPCGLDAGPAFVTSLEFGKNRPKTDVRGNPLNDGFCVEFTLESRSPDCAAERRPHARWMRYFAEGFTVCVACQPPAMRNHSGGCQGDGREADRDVVLQWQAVGNPRCSGTWKRIRKTPECNCPPQHSFVFI